MTKLLYLFHIRIALKRLISETVAQCTSLSFDDQTLLCLIQKKQYIPQSILVDPQQVDYVLGIQRSLIGQVYYTFLLDRSLHCSIPTDSFIKFITTSYKVNKVIPYVHVPNGTNYTSEDKGLAVINVDTTENGSPISYCTDRLAEMFSAYLAEAFTHNERKRGSSSASPPSSPNSRTLLVHEDLNIKNNLPNRKFIPSITLGFTNQVTQVYAKSRSSLFGHIRPFLRDGGIPESARNGLLLIVKRVFSASPFKNRFHLQGSDQDNSYVCIRKKVITEFEKLLGGTDFSGDFLAEGIAILIPFGIGDHRDRMNDFTPGMNGVIAIHCKIPINDRTLPSTHPASSELRAFLKNNGYSSTFPCSVIVYTRKICHYHALRMSKVIKYRASCHLRDTLFWALTERVGHIVDYDHCVFENMNFSQMFHDKAEVKLKSRYTGRAMRCIAAYNKMVSVVLY